MIDKILIIIDMQNDFVIGPLGTPEAKAIIPNIQNKLKYNCYKQVIYTYDTHGRNYFNSLEGKKLPIEHCIYNTFGWEIVDGLKLSTTMTKEVIKSTFGNLYWSFLDLNTFGDIEIVGVCTDICVISNALILKAKFPEHEIIVDANCCAGTTPEMHQKALDVMKSCQIKVINENI